MTSDSKRTALVLLDPGFGGGHRHVIDLASGLSKGFEPIVIGSSPEFVREAKRAKLTAISLPPSRFFGLEDIGPLRAILRQRNFEIIHAHGPRGGWVSALASRGLHAPLVYTDHAWNPDYEIKQPNKGLQLAGLRFVCGIAQKVIVVSKASREFLVGRGIAAAEKTEVIPNGIRLTEIPNSKFQIPNKDHPVVGSVGAFTKRKGHDIFVAAIPAVLAKNSKVRFAIIGDGPEKKNVEKQAIRLGVRRYIHLLGWVDDRERDNERRGWFLYVQSSRDESFGIAAGESLAMGIPVVATDVGGLPEAVEGGGIIVEKENPQALAEGILKLLGNKKLRERLAKTGQEHVRKNYDLKKVVAQIESIYQESLR